MSWNAILKFATAQPSEITGLVATGQTIPFEEASSSSLDQPAIGCWQGWTIIGEPFEYFITQSFAPLIPSGRVLTLIFAGVSGSYGFSLAQDGQLVRSVLTADFEVVQDEGSPFPEEVPFDPEQDPEEWLFQLMTSITGLTLDDLEPLAFELYQAADG